MRRGLGLAAALILLVPVSGCNSVLQLLGVNRVTVRLVNTTNFPIDVDIRISDDQNVLRDVLTSLGERVQVTLAAGQTSSFSRDCDDLQAIIIDNADQDIGLGLGPSQQSDVYRDGSDFNCGDTLVFTFSQANILSLQISFSR